MMATCAGCEAELRPPPPHGGRPPKWCSERCRKETLYSRRCLDCGAMCNKDGRVRGAAERCGPCAQAHSRKLTHNWILAAMREWHDLFSAPPTSVEWNQHLARARLSVSPIYAQKAIDRYESTGRPWPSVSTVQDHFGSWSAGLRAAGFEPISDKDRALGYRGRALRDQEAA